MIVSMLSRQIGANRSSSLKSTPANKTCFLCNERTNYTYKAVYRGPYGKAELSIVSLWSARYNIPCVRVKGLSKLLMSA